MASIGINARLLSNDVLAKWLIEDFPFRIQLAPLFPFYPIAGHALRYATTRALRPGVAIDFDAEITEDTKPPEECNRVFPLVELATQFRVSYKAQDVFSSHVNDQTAVQMALAIRELLYQFWTLFESGDTARPGEFDGLLNLVEPSRVLDLGFQPLTLEALEQGKELVRSNDGRSVVAFTNSVGKRAIHAAHWSRGLAPQYAEITLPCPPDGSKNEWILSFDGAPVYVNDLNRTLLRQADGSVKPLPAGWSQDGSGQAAHIWFFVMGKNNLHGITPAALESGLFVPRSTLLPDGSTLVYHVTMPVGIALGSASSLAVIKNAAIPGVKAGTREGEA